MAGFDAIAPWYERLEKLTFGRRLQDCRTTWLDQVADARRVLLVGEGDGRFLEQLLRRGSATEIIVVEASQRMLALARERSGGSPLVRYVHGDILSGNLELPTVDLIATCFFLDCFGEPELGQVIGRLRRCLGPGGRWLWADFAIPETQPMKLIGRGLVAGLYRFFGMTTGLRTRSLGGVQTHFRKCALQSVGARSSCAGLLATSLYEVVG